MHAARSCNTINRHPWSSYTQLGAGSTTHHLQLHAVCPGKAPRLLQLAGFVRRLQSDLASQYSSSCVSKFVAAMYIMSNVIHAVRFRHDVHRHIVQHVPAGRLSRCARPSAAPAPARPARSCRQAAAFALVPLMGTLHGRMPGTIL